VSELRIEKTDVAQGERPVTQEPNDCGQPAGKVLDHIETYKIVAEWIRFADAKAGVTLTVNGVLLGLLIPTLKSYVTDKTAPGGWWLAVVVVLFIGWVTLLVASAVFSFLCILPLRGRRRGLILEKAAHFHPAAVATHYSVEEPQRFIEDCEKAGLEGLNVQCQVRVRHALDLVAGGQRVLWLPLSACHSTVSRRIGEVAPAHDAPAE
jgi:hypothetical protein